MVPFLLKSESLIALAQSLRSSWHSRDRNAEFSNEAWSRIFSCPDFSRLDFASPEAYQASALGLMKALYTLAYHSLDLPFVASLAAQAAIAPEILYRFGSDSHKLRYLREIQEGRLLVAICNSEPGSGTNLKRMNSHCQVFESGKGILKADKPLATNAHGAKHVFVSAWEQRPSGEPPTLELYFVETKMAEVRNIGGQLIGFRTGNCGSLRIENLEIDVQQSRLGSSGAGILIFKHCFDYERLFLAVIVAGVMEGLQNLGLEKLEQAPHLKDKQFVQEKLVLLASAKAKLTALTHFVISSGFDRLSSLQVELSLLKWICADEALIAVQSVCDLTGWSVLRNDDLMNKVARDFSALRFFGGTPELQKLTIFSWLLREREIARAQAA